MLKARVITALVLFVGLMCAVFLLPPLGWQLFLLGVTAVAGWEWARLAGLGAGPRWVYALATVALASAVPSGWQNGVGAAALVFWVLVVPVWLSREWRVRQPLLLVAVGWLLLLPTFMALAWLREQSPWLVVALMATVWIADTAAYFTGRRFGRRKLAPAISPGKTWEGAVGAVASVTVYGVVLAFTFDLPLLLVTALWFIAVLSIEGDLFESWMKRVAGVKDSGSCLPGHGGILDRIDALTAALPAAQLLTAYYLSHHVG